MSKPRRLTREAECSQGVQHVSKPRGLTWEAECSQGVQHVKADGKLGVTDRALLRLRRD